MKKYVLLMSVLLIGFIVILPSVSHSRPGIGNYGGGYRGPGGGSPPHGGNPPPGGGYHQSGRGYHGGLSLPWKRLSRRTSLPWRRVWLLWRGLSLSIEGGIPTTGDGHITGDGIPIAWGYPYYGGWSPYYWGYGSWYGPWYFPSGYVSVAPTIYATPAPGVYSDSSQQQPYANPDPAFIEKYGQADVPTEAGEWVIVPGQYVNGIWVREHKVWVQGSR